MNKVYTIEGMSCAHCVMSVQKSLSQLNLDKLKVEIGSAEVEFDEKNINEDEIIKTIETAGYKIQNHR